MASSPNQLSDSLSFLIPKSSSSDSFICDTVNTPSSSGVNFPQKCVTSLNYELPSSINADPVVTSKPEKINNLVTNKNSLVITNSRLTPKVNQNQVLSGISFKDEVCFALPPKVTLEDINFQSMSSEQEILHLLHITKEMNIQLKRRKKRSRKSKEHSISKNDDPFLQSGYSHFSGARKEFGSPNSKVNNYGSSLRSDKMVKRNSAVQACPDVSNKDTIRKHSLNLLKFRNSSPVDKPKIIESLRNLNILSKRPHTAVHNNCTDMRVTKHDCNNMKKNSLSDETFSGDTKLQQFSQQSWFNAEDDEERNSKEIFDFLQRKVNSFTEPTNSSYSFQKEDIQKAEETAKVKKKRTRIKKPWKKSEKNERASNSNGADNQGNVMFEKYYDESVVEEGLKNGSLLKGIIRINLKNYKEAYLFSQNDEKDIFIEGIKDRNRALEGDEVAVELFPEDQWKFFPDKSVQKRGKVVRVLKENHPRIAIGSLRQMFSKGNLNGVVLWPRDNRLPRVRIPEHLCPRKFRSNLQQYENTLFEATIGYWDNENCAYGILEQELGEQNNLETETKCILLENNLNVEPVKNPEEFIPIDLDIISAKELEARLDCRTSCVFSIDPEGARDIDDALSCAILPNGNFEIGVHIADVTHYLLPNTLLDKDVREKATSVYLTQSVYHMLPEKLCNLCSLTPNSDKLAFSLFVEMDSNAEIVKHRFVKTVIRTCAQFTYKHAQIIIDEGKDGVVDNTFPNIVNGYSMEDCADVILNLYSLASKLRERRFTGGALKIDQPKIIFHLNENHFPLSYSLYVQKESNWLIEEFMLLANILTANHLKDVYPELALLRNHLPPNEKSLTNVVETLEKIGIYIDPSSAGSIHQSMMQYDSSDESGIARMAVITNLLVKPMVKATYTCSSTPSIETIPDFSHYALNVPFYTHFTSPIRRYADIVVHRLLAASLEYSAVPDWTSDIIQEIAVNCNVKKNSAKRASTMSSELFLKLYLEKNGPVKVKAVVFEVKEKHMEIIDLSTRTVTRIYPEKITEKVKFDSTNDMPSLTVIWKNDEDESKPIKQIIQIFTIIDVELFFKKGSPKINASLLKPSSA